MKRHILMILILLNLSHPTCFAESSLFPTSKVSDPIGSLQVDPILLLGGLFLRGEIEVYTRTNFSFGLSGQYYPSFYDGVTHLGAGLKLKYYLLGHPRSTSSLGFYSRTSFESIIIDADDSALSQRPKGSGSWCTETVGLSYSLPIGQIGTNLHFDLGYKFAISSNFGYLSENIRENPIDLNSTDFSFLIGVPF